MNCKKAAPFLLFFLLFGLLAGPSHAQFPQSLGKSNVEVSFEVDTLAPLNTSQSEFSPVIYKDQLLFTSDRHADLLNRNMEAWSRNSYLSLFWVELGALFDSVAFRNVKRVSNKINIQDHTGPLAFTPNKKEAVFTRVGKAAKVNGQKIRKPALFYAKYKEGDWKEIRRLAFSKKKKVHAHPTFMGQETHLIFASDRKGGPGKTDLFMAKRKEEGWGEPQALPETINSSAKEVFPYYRDSALFFSSKRDGGKGGTDIYCSLLKDNGKWGDPIHFDAPLNSPSDDFGMVLKENGEEGYISSDREGGKGMDDIYKLKVIEKVTVKKKALSGRFKYRKLEGDYPKGRTVELVDDEGNVVARTKTDKNGRFSFKELPSEKDVTVRLKDSDADVEMVMSGKKKGVQLMKDKQGRFVYRQLEGDRTGTQRLKELSDPTLDSAVPDLSGQFVYERLPSKNSGKRTLQLIDDEGNVVRSTRTDKKGNFKFQKLASDKNYRLKLKEVPDEDMNLLIYDGKGRVVAQLKSGANGIFDYRKLSGDKRKKKLLGTQEPKLKKRKQKAVYGKFEYKKLEGDVPGGMKIKVLNDEGKVQFVSRADSAGYFRFVNMSLEDSMVFDVQSSKEPKGEMVVKIMDRYGDVVAVLHKNENGFFVFRELEGDTAKKRLKDEKDKSDLALKAKKDTVEEKESKPQPDKGSKKVGKIHFGHDSSYLGGDSREALNDLAEKLKQSDRSILIEGYASGKGKPDYNKWLSKRRAQRIRKALVKEGIDASRIETEWYGEKRLLNDCKEASDCPDEKHAKNRRVELSYR